MLATSTCWLMLSKRPSDQSLSKWLEGRKEGQVTKVTLGNSLEAASSKQKTLKHELRSVFKSAPANRYVTDSFNKIFEHS